AVGRSAHLNGGWAITELITAVPVAVVDRGRSVVARARVISVAIAAAVIAAIDRRPDERRELLDDAADLTRGRGRRMCLGRRLRPSGDLGVCQARRGVSLQARQQRAVDRHLSAAASALVVLLRGGGCGRTDLAVGRPRVEAQRDQLVLNLAHVVMAERK